MKDPSTVDVAFTYTFTVANAAKTVSGLGETSLTVRLIDGHFAILREAGKVVSKN